MRAGGAAAMRGAGAGAAAFLAGPATAGLAVRAGAATCRGAEDATTFAAGVPLVDALNSTAGAAGNSVYAKAIRRIRDDVTTGTTLYNSIKSTGLFPNMLLQMVSIGEESGALDDMLDKVATHYEAAVDNAVDSLSSLMEPLIMSILGVLVGGLMIAMYLPIFMLGSVI